MNNDIQKVSQKERTATNELMELMKTYAELEVIPLVSQSFGEYFYDGACANAAGILGGSFVSRYCYHTYDDREGPVMCVEQLLNNNDPVFRFKTKNEWKKAIFVYVGIKRDFEKAN